ncbi:MAG TPA: tyrosine-type recombinase/integrase, partial [Stellaceae bacterium]|nr:tyrosine-type recombinase/integrase [Stellaceae bacterium]
MRGKITKRFVDALKPGTDGAEAMLWDAELKGFGVRVQRGGGKSYVLHYRLGTGRGAPLRKLTIGKHGSPWTAETARTEAKRLLGLVAHGQDPAGAKSAAKIAPTVTDLATRFLAEHAEAKRKASTAKEYRRLLEHVVLPAIGKRKATDITRRDIERLHQARRATPTEANRALACLSAMFNLAERWALRPDGSNPCRHVEKYPQRRRERFLSPAELARLGDALAAHDGSPYAVAAVKLLVFTGARLGEVLGLKWEWIDFDHGEARLPDSKTGAKTVHLPPPALAVLAELPRLDGNPHVIAGAKPGAALVNLEKPWRAIRDRVTFGMWRDSGDEKIATLFAELSRKLKDRQPTAAEFRKAAAERDIALPVGLTDVRIHDLRHAFASVAASSGMGLPIIGKMLGHSQPATTARYAHLASDPVKAAAAATAGKIAAAMVGGSGKAGKESGAV